MLPLPREWVDRMKTSIGIVAAARTTLAPV
jgi:hypothetical protein